MQCLTVFKILKLTYMFSMSVYKTGKIVRIVRTEGGWEFSDQSFHIFTHLIEQRVRGLFTDLLVQSLNTYGYSSLTSHSIWTWQNCAVPPLLVLIRSVAHPAKLIGIRIERKTLCSKFNQKSRATSAEPHLRLIRWYEVWTSRYTLGLWGNKHRYCIEDNITWFISV